VTVTSALVLFSGGQDSTVCLGSALQRFDRVETIGFDYGQRHRVEIRQRQVILAGMAKQSRWASRLGPDVVLKLPALREISETSLTRDSEISLAASGLPTTFVPGRNLLFLTYAAAYAYRRNITTLLGGMCETDYSGYPDCRRTTIDALERSLSLGMDRPINIETPLMHVDKAGTWALAEDIGGDDFVSLIIEHTHTCYLGDRTQRHEWGFGCGSCPACQLRANGWERWRAQPSDIKDHS
jgi:7-cyano-7-deazaguanine synthase